MPLLVSNNSSLKWGWHVSGVNSTLDHFTGTLLQLLGTSLSELEGPIPPFPLPNLTVIGDCSLQAVHWDYHQPLWFCSVPAVLHFLREKHNALTGRQKVYKAIKVKSNLARHFCKLHGVMGSTSQISQSLFLQLTLTSLMLPEGVSRPPTQWASCLAN